MKYSPPHYDFLLLTLELITIRFCDRKVEEVFRFRIKWHDIFWNFQYYSGILKISILLWFILSQIWHTCFLTLLEQYSIYCFFPFILCMRAYQKSLRINLSACIVLLCHLLVSHAPTLLKSAHDVFVAKQIPTMKLKSAAQVQIPTEYITFTFTLSYHGKCINLFMLSSFCKNVVAFAKGKKFTSYSLHIGVK